MVDRALKAKVRGELFRCAAAGQFVTYTEFFNRIRPGTPMGSFPYQTHFDEIAKEERNNGYPDITFLVHRTGQRPQYPAQIDFRPADPPDQQQLDSLRKGADGIIAMYCPPNTANPYR
ncbi:MAG: hypothetical protein WA268_18700 [Xanthobacteraceae bacterium]